MATLATPTVPTIRRPVEGGRVWVLEDSPLEAEMARRAIATDHAVEIFPDSPAVLERIANGSRPDMLVLDCQLPTMSGLEVCRFLRESFDEMELPILMLTVQGDRADIVDGLKARANDYLTKPYDVSELLARVGTLVRTRHLHRARVRRAREVALTAKVGAMLTRGIETSAQPCVEAIGRHLDATSAALWIAQSDGRLGLRAFYGCVASGCMAVPSMGKDRCARFVLLDSETDGMVDDPRWRAARERTFVEMPLVMEARAVGVLTVGTPRHLEPEEIDALTPLADLLALGLERMRAECERLALEQRAREEAEAANRIKDEFLAMLSHELRGPLNAISGWVRMLRSGAVPPSGTDRALATIERNTVAQSQLIEDLLDVSRIVTGKLTIEKQAVDLADTVEGVLDSLRPVAAEKKLTLVRAVNPIGKVLGDPARLRQVATNLVANALKFTPEGGRITVSVHSEDNVGVVRVEDTGQGIDPSFLSHVFERFRQADGSTARKHGGLGLGLALVHHVVALHGGSVHAASEGPGRGATFTVKIPLFVAEASVPASETRSIPQGATACANLRVVVVDDEVDARELVARVLANQGADVRMAGRAEEALKMIRAEPPDVLVTDLAMPGTTGFELLERVRALPPAEGGRVPAIALTGHGHPESRQAALRVGFDQFLTKPIEFEAVVDAVARLGRKPSRHV